METQDSKSSGSGGIDERGFKEQIRGLGGLENAFRDYKGFDWNSEDEEKKQCPGCLNSRKEPSEETCVQPAGALEPLLIPTECGATYCIPRIIFLQGARDNYAITGDVNTTG